MAAELCEGWQPTLYLPEAAKEVFGPSLEAGRARRSAGLPPLRVVADVRVLVSDDAEELAAGRQRVRAYIARYVGGMGARGRNFYNALVARYGFEGPAAGIEELYQSGRKEAAAAAVPGELVDAVALVGPPGLVAERVAAFRDSGVTGAERLADRGHPRSAGRRHATAQAACRLTAVRSRWASTRW
ncbi:LLM class flavin-dependent oxidoreductase [Streptomyces sp. NPDC004270]